MPIPQREIAEGFVSRQSMFSLQECVVSFVVYACILETGRIRCLCLGVRLQEESHSHVALTLMPACFAMTLGQQIDFCSALASE